MRDHEGRRGLEKALRKSQRTMLIVITLAMVGIALLWGAHEYWDVPAWPVYTFGCVAAYAIYGEASNMFLVRRRLRLLDQHRA